MHGFDHVQPDDVQVKLGIVSINVWPFTVAWIRDTGVGGSGRQVLLQLCQ